jgi:hypothetical protein
MQPIATTPTTPTAPTTPTTLSDLVKIEHKLSDPKKWLNALVWLNAVSAKLLH